MSFQPPSPIYHLPPPLPPDSRWGQPITVHGQPQSLASILNPVEETQFDAKSLGLKAEYKRIIEKYDPMLMQNVKTEENAEEEEKIKAAGKIEGVDDCCFTFRKKYTPTGPNIPPIIETFVDLKSWYLRKAGREVIGEHVGVSWNARNLEVDTHIILPYFQKLRAYLIAHETKVQANDYTPTEDDTLLSTHLTVFLTFLSTEFATLLDDLSDLAKAKETTWKTQWALWKVGSLLLISCPVTSEPFVVRLVSATHTKDSLQLQYEHLDYTPMKSGGWGMASGMVYIERFFGRVKTNTLEAYPLEDHPEYEALRERLIKRGERWKELRGIHHLHYSGSGYMRDAQQRVKSITVRGRVMVDRG